MGLLSKKKQGCCGRKACKVFGLVSMQLLLLAFSLAGNFFSAWTLADCRFLYADPTDFPLPPQPDNSDSDGSSTTTTSRYSGYVGLYTVEQEFTELTDSGSTSRVYTQCTPISGYVIDEFDTKYRIAQLMGVVGLTTGGLASIVIILTFVMEMCCATPGVQYALGIMYVIAAATQGLTFLGIDTPKCNALGCVISTTATWSILAVCLYFIALVHAFVVPFPNERICSTECCCPCRGKGEEVEEEENMVVEEEEEDDDIEAQNDYEDGFDVEEGGDTAKSAAMAGEGLDPNAAAAVAGVAAGAAVVGVAAAAAGGKDDDDGEDDELQASLSADAAAASENCAAALYSSVKGAVDKTE